MNHETDLINAFFVPAKRARFIGFAQNPKRRQKFLHTLYHTRDLDPRFIEEIPSSNQSARAICALLTKYGAPSTCHIISGNSELDGRELPLVEALEEIVALNPGTLVSCIPGRLGYYEGEDQNVRLILHKSAG